MTKIKLGEKTIEFGDGLNVSIDGDKITVSAKPQQFFIPSVYPQYPIAPFTYTCGDAVTESGNGN